MVLFEFPWGGGGGMEQLEVGKTGFLKDARKKERKKKRKKEKKKKSISWVTTNLLHKMVF